MKTVYFLDTFGDFERDREGRLWVEGDLERDFERFFERCFFWNKRF